MLTDKTITEAGLITTFMNYRNAFIVNFEGADVERQYYKPHERRKSTKEFNNFINEIMSYDFINDRFMVLEKKGFVKSER